MEQQEQHLLPEPQHPRAQGAPSLAARSPQPPMASLWHWQRQQQQSSWDCGLACCDMVLSAAGLQQQPGLLCSSARAAAVSAAAGSAAAADSQPPHLWTVDLSLLLAQRGLQHSYLTTCAGVNPQHAGLPFYSSLDQDAARLPLLFQQARALGVAVQEQHWELSSVLPLLSASSHACIALVDARLLACCHAGCRGSKEGSEEGEGGSSSSYMGHYIVLTGAQGSRVHYLDPGPGTCAAGCSMQSSDFEAARCAEGTDEDLLLFHCAQGGHRGGSSASSSASSSANSSASSSASSWAWPVLVLLLALALGAVGAPGLWARLWEQGRALLRAGV